MGSTNQSVLGISVHANELYYTELSTHPDHTRLGEWGVLDLQHILEQEAPDNIQIRAYIDRIAQLTSASIIAYEATDFADQQETWSELFMVAGFTVHTYTRAEALAHLAYSTSHSLSILYFQSPELAVLYREGNEVSTYSYPFSAEAILDLQDHSEDYDVALALCGHTDETPSELVHSMRAYDIPAELLNVWRASFTLAEYIPSMHRDDSLAFVLAIAYAQYASEFALKERKPSWYRVLKPVVWQEKSLRVSTPPATAQVLQAPREGSLKEGMNIDESLHMSPEKEADKD